MRQAAKRDKNEELIVYALLAGGCSVTRLSQKGVPDLLVGRQGVNYLLEVKDAKGTLTGDQLDWSATWCGQASIVRTPEEALEAVGL